jgi:hypothetical protein
VRLNRQFTNAKQLAMIIQIVQGPVNMRLDFSPDRAYDGKETIRNRSGRTDA